MEQPVLCFGTYSGGLLGYKLSSTTSDDSISLRADPAFAYRPHAGCVKAIRAQEMYLLTGSTDETAKVFDLGKRREQGTLTGHSASVTAIDVAVTSQRAATALTGDDNGGLILWSVAGGKDWDLLLRLRGHTASMNGIAIHPSQRLALTVSANPERALRLWDLMRGTCAVSQKFEEAPLSVSWTPDGEFFVVLFPKQVIVRRAGDATLEAVLDTEQESSERYTATCVLDSATFIVGSSTGTLRMCVLEKDEDAKTLSISVASTAQQQSNAAASRVKAMCALPPLASEPEGALWFASVNPDGVASLWLSDADGAIEHLLEVDTGARVTCMDCN